MAGDFAFPAWVGAGAGGGVSAGAAGAVSAAESLPARVLAAVVQPAVDAALSAVQVPLSILDVGCGEGQLLHEMVARVPYGEAFVGVQSDPSELAAARRVADPRVELLLSAPESLPFDDAGFDLVIAARGVLHWRDPAAGVTELARVVSDTGRVVLVERARAGRVVRDLLAAAGLELDREETVAWRGFTLPLARAFIAFR